PHRGSLAAACEFGNGQPAALGGASRLRRGGGARRLAAPDRRLFCRRARWYSLASTMTDGVRTLAGFLRFIDIDARDAGAHPDAFDRLRAGDLQAVMVHGVYEPQVLDEIGERLERHDPPFLKTWFPKEFRSWFYGRNLNLAHPSLAGYFEEARQFHADLDALFPRGCGLLARVGGILAQLDHGRPFVPAPGPDPDRHYMFTTLRAHMEEGFIPPHLDNEQALRPSYSHLRTMVERHMTSFVLMLKAPESGGTLDVFDYVCDPEDA